MVAAAAVFPGRLLASTAISWLAMGVVQLAAAADDGIQATPAMGWSTWCAPVILSHVTASMTVQPPRVAPWCETAALRQPLPGRLALAVCCFVEPLLCVDLGH